MFYKLFQNLVSGSETGCYDIAHYLAEQECESYIATSGGELLKYVKKIK